MPGIVNDRRQFEKIAGRFGFKSDELIVLMEPKMKDCNAIAIGTHKLCKQNPHETVLALFCYSSHGMIQDGRQMIVVNQFNEAKGFYRLYGAEENMRTATTIFSNAYIVGIFACCREIFLVTQHSGCISLAQKYELDTQRRLRDKRRSERLIKLI